MLLFNKSLNVGGDSLNIKGHSTLVIDTSKWTPALYKDTRLVVDDDNLYIYNANGSLLYSIQWLEGRRVYCAKIFENGNILIWTNDEKLYITNTTLSRIDEKFILDENGDVYIPVAGKTYQFFPLYIHNTGNYVGADAGLWVWGNYSNVFTTGVTTYMFYTPDFGETLKICLNVDTFSPYFVPRHAHEVAYNKFENEWYVNFGDHQGDLGWIKGKYTPATDTWDWQNIFDRVIDYSSEHLKNTFTYFRQINGETYIYFGTDMTLANLQHLQGIWRAKTSEFSDTSKHEHILKLSDYGLENYVSSGILNEHNGVITFTTGEWDQIHGSRYLILASDYGHGQVDYIDINDYLPDIRIQNLNGFDDNGYVRMNTNAIDPAQTSTVFFRVGTDLLTGLEVISI